MFLLKLVVCSAAIAVAHGVDDFAFPPGFKFGVASAAYQVEGAWNASDKGENIWDRFVHNNPAVISDRSNGDVACDSYRLWRRDVEMAAEVGAHFYRISIAWTRLLPKGFSNYISEDGSKYYSDLIDGLLEKGIEPVVTLYHWDLPQVLQDLGGWTNPLIKEWFGDYARVAYSLFGDRVKTWITINEPLVVCDVAYNTGMLAPGIKDALVGAYLCNKNVLMAHATAWRIYDKEFREKQKGEVSITNHVLWFEAATDSDEDVELTELANQNLIGRYSHPIYSKEGGWPPAIEKILAENAKKINHPASGLPRFTPEEIEFVKGTYDFYGLNHYTSRLVEKAAEGEKVGLWPLLGSPDLGAKFYPSKDWRSAKASWLYVYPEGFRHLFNWLKSHYGDVKIFVTENGYSTAAGKGLEDVERIQYYEEYLKQVLLAIKEDGVQISGYTAWTLMDNFEWMDGYRTQFGLYEVDFTSENRTRTPRASARYYSNVIKAHSLNFADNKRNEL